eukprot:scaffold765_cov345-Prasinococcus_capsulatus_cf.AAC.9
MATSRRTEGMEGCCGPHHPCHSRAAEAPEPQLFAGAPRESALLPAARTEHPRAPNPRPVVSSLLAPGPSSAALPAVLRISAVRLSAARRLAVPPQARCRHQPSRVSRRLLLGQGADRVPGPLRLARAQRSAANYPPLPPLPSRTAPARLVAVTSLQHVP